MPYKVFDIAEYIIFYSHLKNYSISNLKLQKLLYFIQKEFFKNGRKCFEDEIEFWDCGPIIDNIYKKYKVYSGGNIPGFIAKNPSNITDDDKAIMATVIDKYKYNSSTEMLKIINGQLKENK